MEIASGLTLKASIGGLDRLTQIADAQINLVINANRMHRLEVVLNPSRRSTRVPACT